MTEAYYEQDIPDDLQEYFEPIPANHPTVKPLKIFQFLIALACPEDGVVIDPFAGSGTCGVAAAAIGRDCIMIEREEEYCQIAEGRVAHAEKEAQQETLL